MPSTRIHQQGLTLLELLVALAIAAILMGLAVPSMKTMLSSSEMSSTNNEFVYSLQSARSEAIKRAIPVGVCSSTNPMAEAATCAGTFSDGWIVFVDTDGNGSRQSAEAIVSRSDELSTAYAITSNNMASMVYFDATGSSINSATGAPLSDTIEFNLDSGSQKRLIRIGASGRISTEDNT